MFYNVWFKDGSVCQVFANNPAMARREATVGMSDEDLDNNPIGAVEEMREYGAPEETMAEEWERKYGVAS